MRKIVHGYPWGDEFPTWLFEVARCVFVYTTEVEIYKDNLAFPYFSICLLGQASQRTNEKYGKRIGKTSELVFPPKPTLATCTYTFHAFLFFFYTFLFLSKVLLHVLFVNEYLNSIKLKCLL